MIIRFAPEADAELAEAREWYSLQREDLDLACSVLTTHCRESFAIPIHIQIFTKRLDAQSFGGFRSLCFMKSLRMRFR